MQAHLRYIAIVTERPEVLAAFYATYFAMRELGRGDEGDISLTDGFYNLTLLKQRASLHDLAERPGLSHYGIEIDDIREVEARLEEFAPDADIREEPGGLHHGEYRVFDPDGLAISLSMKNFHVSGDTRSLPSIRHIALSVPEVPEMHDFYTNVFGFRETKWSAFIRTKNRPDPCYFAGDGSTNMALLLEPALMTRGEDMRWGFNHFGFVVPDMEEMLRALPSEAGAARRPPRAMAEERAHDPDGNAIDLSYDMGYEVDYDVWVRAGSSNTSSDDEQRRVYDALMADRAQRRAAAGQPL